MFVEDEWGGLADRRFAAWRLLLSYLARQLEVLLPVPLARRSSLSALFPSRLCSSCSSPCDEWAADEPRLFSFDCLEEDEAGKKVDRSVVSSGSIAVGEFGFGDDGGEALCRWNNLRKDEARGLLEEVGSAGVVTIVDDTGA